MLLYATPVHHADASRGCMARRRGIFMCAIAWAQSIPRLAEPFFSPSQPPLCRRATPTRMLSVDRYFRGVIPQITIGLSNFAIIASYMVESFPNRLLRRMLIYGRRLFTSHATPTTLISRLTTRVSLQGGQADRLRVYDEKRYVITNMLRFANCKTKL